MTTWFISDLHLEPSRPDSIQQLLAFLEKIQGQAEALYILGDFFEYWIGDDWLETPAGQQILPIIKALRETSDSGVRLYFQHGNRDFLIGSHFVDLIGADLLPEQQMISLYGQSALIMHGDTLCTDDVQYQKARAVFRDPKWQSHVLNWTIEQRLERAKEMREVSQQNQQYKSDDIMDVNQQSLEQVMQEAGVSLLIHGHTHRPAVHDFMLDGKPAQRIVLGDWYQQGSFLKVEAGQVSLSGTFA